MAKGSGKSSATSATRKKHAAAKASDQQQQQKGGSGGQAQGGGAPKEKVKGTKAEKKAAKNAPRKKVYIAPVKPGRAVVDPLDGGPSLAHVLPADLVVILRGLGKKAGVTRAKAVDELRVWISRADQQREGEGEGEGEGGVEEVLETMMPVWIHHLPSLLTHPLRRLRISSGALHADLIRRLPSFLLPTSSSYTVPTSSSYTGASTPVLAIWCLAAHSGTTPLGVFEAYAGRVEREEVAAVGPAVYRAVLDPVGVYREITFASVGSGGAGDGAAGEDEEEEEGEGVGERASRIRVGALGALGWVMRRFSVKDAASGHDGASAPEHGADVAPSGYSAEEREREREEDRELEVSWGVAVSDAKVWGVLNAELGWERKAGWVFLGDVLGAVGRETISEALPVISPAVLQSAWRETDTAVQSAMWAPLLTFLKAWPEAWTLGTSHPHDGVPRDAAGASRQQGVTGAAEDGKEAEEAGDAGISSNAAGGSSAYDAFLSFIERGCGGVWPVLVVVVSTIPPAVFNRASSDPVRASQPLTTFFDAVWAAEGAVRKQHRKEWIEAVFEVLVLLVRRRRKSEASNLLSPFNLLSPSSTSAGEELSTAASSSAEALPTANIAEAPSSSNPLLPPPASAEDENAVVMQQIQRAFDVLRKGGVGPEVVGGVMRRVVGAKVAAAGGASPATAPATASQAGAAPASQPAGAVGGSASQAAPAVASQAAAAAHEAEAIPNAWEIVRTEVVRARDEHVPRLVRALGAGAGGGIRDRHTGEMREVKELEEDVVKGGLERMRVSLEKIEASLEKKHEPAEEEGEDAGQPEKSEEEGTVDSTLFVESLKTFGERVWSSGSGCVELIDTTIQTHASELLRRAPHVLRVYFTARKDEGRVGVVWRVLCDGVAGAGTGAALDGNDNTTTAGTDNTTTAAATESTSKSIERLLDLASTGVHVSASGILDELVVRFFAASNARGERASQDFLRRILRAPRGAVLSEEGVQRVKGVLEGRVRRGVEGVLRGGASASAHVATEVEVEAGAEVQAEVGEVERAAAGAEVQAEEASALSDALELLELTSLPLSTGCVVDVWIVAFLLPSRRMGERAEETRVAAEGLLVSERARVHGGEEVYPVLVHRLREILMYESALRPADVLRAASSSSSLSSSLFGLREGRELKWDILPGGEDMDAMLDASLATNAGPTTKETQGYARATESNHAAAKETQGYARLMHYTLALALQDRVGAREKERVGWVLRHVAYLAVSSSSSFSSSYAYPAPTTSHAHAPSRRSASRTRTGSSRRRAAREAKRVREDADRVVGYLISVENSREAREEGVSLKDAKPKTRLGGVLRTQIARAMSSAVASTSTSTATSTSAAAATQHSLVLETLLERILRDAEREEGDAWVGYARRKGCSPTVSSAILRAVARSGLEPVGMERYRNEVAAELFGVGGGGRGSSSSKKAYKALRDLADVLPRAELGVGVLSQQRAVRLVKGMEGVVLADDESSSSSSSEGEEDIESAIIAVLPALVPLLVGTEGGHWAFVGDVVESVLGRVADEGGEEEEPLPTTLQTLADLENALKTVRVLDELAGRKNEEWNGRKEGVRGLVWGVVGWLAPSKRTSFAGATNTGVAGSRRAQQWTEKTDAWEEASAARKRCVRLALEVLQQGTIRGGGDVLGGLVWVLGHQGQDEDAGEVDDQDLGHSAEDEYVEDEYTLDLDLAEDEYDQHNAEHWAEESWDQEDEEEDIEAIKLAYPILKRAAEAWTEGAVVEAAVGPVAEKGEDTPKPPEEPKQARLPDVLLDFLLLSSAATTTSYGPASYARTRFGTLVAWTLLFDLFENTSLRVRAAYIEQLRDAGVFGEVFMPMVVEMLGVALPSSSYSAAASYSSSRGGEGSGGGAKEKEKEWAVGGWSVEEFYVQYYEPSSSPDSEEKQEDDAPLRVFAAHLYFRALLRVPGLVRAWVEGDSTRASGSKGTSGSAANKGSTGRGGAGRAGAARQYDRTVREKLVSLTAAQFSPGIIRTELGGGAEAALEDETFKVRVLSSKAPTKARITGVGGGSKGAGGGGAGGAGAGGEVVARYTVDEHVLSLRVKVPAAYPLERIEVGEDPSSTTRPGVDEARWRLWKFGVQQVVWGAGGGGVWDGVRVWKRNVQGWFEGQVECAICYSIISLMDGTLPARPCRTCKNKFHGGCLYKWFHTSHSSSCPLCRSDMF